MVIDPRDGNINAQARRARALCFPFPRNYSLDCMNIMFQIWKYMRSPLRGNIKSDIAPVILPCLSLQTCNEWFG